MRPLICICLLLFSCSADIRSQDDAKQSGVPGASEARYPDTTEGLQIFWTDLLSACKRGDDAAVRTLVKETEIPNYREWFLAMYPADKAESRAEPYGRTVQADQERLRQLARKLAHADGEILVRSVNTSPEKGNSLEEGILHSARAPLDVYLASWKPHSPADAQAKPIGYFLYVNGGFRWDSLITFVVPKAVTDSQNSSAGDSEKLVVIQAKKADYPTEAIRKGIQGQVLLKVHVTETGDVSKVDVVSGDPLLASAAEDAAKEWKFKPFIKGGVAVPVNTTLPFDFYFGDKSDVSGADSPKSMGLSGTVAPTASKAPTSSSSGPAGQSNAPQPIPLNSRVTEGMLMHLVNPIYPQEASIDGIQGAVVLQAIITAEGRVSDLAAISGPAILIPAAMGAVQQWRYRPYKIDGKPVPVRTQIVVNFKLR